MVFDEVDKQRYHRQETGTPALLTNQAGDPAQIPFNQRMFTESQPTQNTVARGVPQHQEEEAGEPYINMQPSVPDDNTEMEDTIVLRTPHPRTDTESQRNPATLVSEETRMQRPQRVRKPVDLFKPAVWRVRAIIARTNDEPRTLEEALGSDDAANWKTAWDSEVKSLTDNGTWILEDLPEGRTAIGCRWVFKIKEDGRYKAPLVAKGYAQARD